MSQEKTSETPQEAHGVEFPDGQVGRFLFWVAVLFSVFQIVTAAHIIDLASQITRAFHVGFLMLLAFPLAFGSKAARSGSSPGVLRSLAFMSRFISGGSIMT